MCIEREPGVDGDIVAAPVESEAAALRDAERERIRRRGYRTVAHELERVARKRHTGISGCTRPELHVISAGLVAPVLDGDRLGPMSQQADDGRRARGIGEWITLGAWSRLQ